MAEASVTGKSPGARDPSRRGTGKPRKIDAAGDEVLRELHRQYEGASVSVLAGLFCERLGVTLHELTVRRALKRLGLVPTRPRGLATARGHDDAGTPPVETRYQAWHREGPPAAGGYPTDLSDDEWAVVEPLLRPARYKNPPQNNARSHFNAAMYVLRTGCPWRFLPREFGKWNTAYQQFKRWRDRGLLQAVNAALVRQERVATGRDAEPTAAIVDSQSARTTEKGGPAATTPGRKSTVASGTSWSTRRAYFSTSTWDAPPSGTTPGPRPCSPPRGGAAGPA